MIFLLPILLRYLGALIGYAILGALVVYFVCANAVRLLIIRVRKRT